MDIQMQKAMYEALGGDAAVKRRTESHKKKITEKEANKKIYFIFDEGLVKIGFSEYPLSRLDQIKTSRPSAFMLGYINGGNKLEKEIHKKVSEWHFAREWFIYSEEVKSIIEDYMK